MEDNPVSKKTHFEPVAIILTFCTISAVFIYLIYSGNFVFGSTAGGWVYPNKPWVVSIPKLIPLVSLIIIGLITFLGSKLIQKHEKWTLLGSLVLAIAMQILISSMVYNTLGDIILSPDANSFYSASQQYSPSDLLAQYQSSADSLPGHAKSNMPGKVLFFHLLSLFTRNTQIMGYVIIAISALGGLLLYGICKRLFHDRQIGLYAFVLYALIPCKQEFFPILNTVTPVFILLSLFLFAAYLDSKKKWLLILLGVSLYLLCFFDPSPLVIGLVFVGLLIHAVAQKSLTFKELGWIILITLLSFLAIHGLMLILFSFDIFKAFVYMLKDAALFNSTAGRPYSVWIKENLKEFFFGAGLPIMMIFVYSLFSLGSHWKDLLSKGLRWSVENTYLVSLLVTFGVVLLMGINRGEVTRLWIYLAVFFQVPAAYYSARVAKSKLAFVILAGTVLLQTLVSLQRIVFIVK